MRGHIIGLVKPIGNLGKFMKKNILSLFLLAITFQSVMTASADETREEVTARRAARDELKASKAESEAAKSRYTKALGQQGVICAGSNNGSQACQDAIAETNALSIESDRVEQLYKSKENAMASAREAASDRREDQTRSCESYKKEMKTKAPAATSENENQDGDTGTALMRKCVAISGNHMRYLYSSNKRPFSWKDYTEATDECLGASQECGGNADQSKVQACSGVKALAARCDAAAFIINEFGRDWRSSDHVKPAEVKGGTPEIKCSAVGLATVDYEGCVKFVQNGDIMDAAQTAVQTGQELYYKDKAMTAQMEAANSTNTATASLEALRTGVKGQEDIMTQRAALNTGKFAALATYYSEIPSIDDLKEKCKGYRKPEGLDSDGLESDKVCSNVVGRQQDFAFLMNQTAKEKMKAKLAKVGIDVASNALMAGLMAKRAGDIKDAIAKVDAFKPIDPLAPAADTLQTTYCQQNPGDAKCLTGGLDRTFDATSDNVITFGEGGTGTSYSNTNPYQDPTAGTTNSTGTTGKNSIGGVGSVIAAAQQSGGLESIASGATVSKGAAPTGSGGGGGGGGGSSGGGGGGAPGAQNPGGTSAAIAGRAPSYGGGSGTLSMMGGFGINKSKSGAKDDGNPFGKLFNKDGNKSGVINFQGRSPASVGNKGDNLFDMISKRYTTVNSDKRLIEYELTK